MEHHIVKSRAGRRENTSELYVLVVAGSAQEACDLAAGTDVIRRESRFEHVASGGVMVQGPGRVLQRSASPMSFTH